MIQKIPASDRHYQSLGWLKTYWLFSFGRYFDPENVRFGNLRVFNDDRILPHTGFDTHAHSEMEIVTIVLEGELTHKDSSGGEGTIGPGEVQRMSAGTGIRHSEKNEGDEEVHLYQIWFFPDEEGLEPGYEQKRFPLEAHTERLKPLVQPGGEDGTVSIHAGIRIYQGNLDSGEVLDYEVPEDRGAFIYLTTGEVNIGDLSFGAGDQARVPGPDSLHISGEKESSFILIDVSFLDE